MFDGFFRIGILLFKMILDIYFLVSLKWEGNVIVFLYVCYEEGLVKVDVRWITGN